jgi:hypothetical protein
VYGGVARIIFVVEFGAVEWISRVTQFAVIPCRNVRFETGLVVKAKSLF